MTSRQVISPNARQALYKDHSYSPAIRAGDLLFVSGQVGSLEDGSPEPHFAKQVQLAFDNLVAVLAAAGCTLDDVVDVTTFHTDLKAQFEAVQPIRINAFGNGPLPNWTAVGVTFLSGFDFEIKVIARIPGSN
ncbi:RidA family protein [Paraburkholderia rhizosphaerae]|uniref:Enamine deaminase RidA (YjgF/YER057c/UK114 family) n=1 Tax=Paraburkholderia rhizosphaerae TaxID=480658 RepID=A0A4R8L7H9_9BURK|nr:RidA family protein [Paraburkholderia rhizosphaerae]TDY37850.1 enamine deaminase RidA (YjgF/YER057c/UK114 family) [Paraburkholderia rhizosphaerae]